MNNEQSYNEINKHKEQLKTKIDDILTQGISLKNETEFESVLKCIIIPYMWMSQFPHHFLNCYVTTDEYNTNNCSGYSWYMFVKNSSFNHKIFMTTGYDFYIDKHAVIKRMNEIIQSALNTDNIIMWCVEHFY